ncbi:hypothetical protein GCAAIG_01950 [Candidatus Electronema halotolerans]
MKKLMLVLFASSLLLLNGYAKNAAAQSGFYNMAKRTSSKLVSAAWNNLGQDCHRADNLVQIVGDAVDRVVRDIKNRRFTGKMAVDFGNGYIAGLNSSLDDIVNKCTDECSMIGNASGEWSAEIFCAVSEAIGSTASFEKMTDRPNIVCGESYRMSCESTFVSKSGQRCSQYAKGQNFESFYPASKNGCCAYDRK